MQTHIVKLLASGAMAATLLSGWIVTDLHGSGFETVKGSGRSNQSELSEGSV